MQNGRDVTIVLERSFFKENDVAQFNKIVNFNILVLYLGSLNKLKKRFKTRSYTTVYSGPTLYTVQ